MADAIREIIDGYIDEVEASGAPKLAAELDTKELAERIARHLGEACHG